MLSVLLCSFVFVISTIAHSAPRDHVVIQNLTQPWAIVPSPYGDIWITEKSGKIKIYDSKYTLQREVTGFPDLVDYGEGGLLDLAFHPQFRNNGWIYVAYAVADPTGHHTQINRFQYSAGKLTDRKIVYDGPSSNAGTHFGARLIFDSKGFLFASFGERRQWTLAQDLNEKHGKIVRLKDDGSIPSDNPLEVGGVRSAFYSYGHRNPQGLDFDPRNGRLYSSEHGPSGYEGFGGGGDEINEIVAGGNYGWPASHHAIVQAGTRAPLAEYTPAIAPSGIIFYTGSKIPQWKNQLFVATLRGQHLLRLKISLDGKIEEQEKLLLSKYGRLRDVATSPTGTLLVLAQRGKVIEIR